MSRRILALLATLGVISVCAASAAAQVPPPSAQRTAQWTAPRTPDGRPDLEGIWTNGTLTPFERPVAQANKPYLTEEEAAEVERQAELRRANPARGRCRRWASQVLRTP